MTIYSSQVKVETHNAATDYDVMNDSFGPIQKAVKLIEWSLLRLSDQPPTLSPDALFGALAINGHIIDRALTCPDNVLKAGRIDGVGSAAQMAALQKVAKTTIAAVLAQKKPGATLDLGHVRAVAKIEDDGFFMMLRVNFRWLEPAE